MASEEANNRISLKEFILNKLADNEKQSKILAAMMEKRLDGMNEFRNALKDQSVNAVSRAEFQVQIEKITGDIGTLREVAAEARGKASQTSLIATLLIALLGLFVSILTLVWNLK